MGTEHPTIRHCIDMEYMLRQYYVMYIIIIYS